MNVQTSSLLETIETLPASSTLLLHEVSWAEYEDLLALLPDRPLRDRDGVESARLGALQQRGLIEPPLRRVRECV